MLEIAADTATNHAQSVVHRLFDTDYDLPDEIRDDILALGQAAVPALLEILEDALSTSPVGGWGPAHAAQLLGELHATAAIEPMLEVLAGTDAQDLLLHDNIFQALPEIGAAATEPMLRAFANNADPTFRYSLSTVLAEWQTHDDRIFEILIDQLRREPALGAGNLEIYGDPRAVPHLLEALDRYTLVESANPLANHTLIELRAAIEELGGTLTTEQQRKCRRGRELADVLSRKPDAMIKSHRREVIVVPEPRSPRQLGDEGLVVFWRDGEPGRRQGLACTLSMCPHPLCACELVYVNGFVIDEQATAVSWYEDGVHVTLHAGTAPQRVTLEQKMIAIVDPDSGETRAHPELPDAVDPALVDWLGSEMDEELLEVLHRYRARAKGYPPEQPRTDIDVEVLKEVHLTAFEELFKGTRSDEFLLAGNRYWTAIFLCPYTDCNCHKLRVAFFDDKAKPGSGDTVGSVLLDLGGAEGFEIVEMAAECEAPEHLIRELWALFGRRHRVAAFLRHREAQAKAVGSTLCQPVAKPVRAAPKPGRNDPCPCGSGVKFKKCCLGKDSSTNTR